MDAAVNDAPFADFLAVICICIAGLFHRAISQSGTALAHWALMETPREQALRFAGQLNCPIKVPEEMVNCLKAVNPLELVEVHKEVLVRE
jgi:carboxylesterase type B